MKIQVEVPDYIAKKFAGRCIKWEEILLEKELEEIDGKSWETIVDFEEGENLKNILNFLEKDGKKMDEKS